jgi:hypothetical protein
LQNPARFPDQRLQQYAQGQQPTGQVPPPMAANELTIRNAQRQAASRQSAMQNNPQNSPTVFQQKDMELQQKAQQLAAMQQQMQQQMQQKEQQLGVAGALMAKKAQDLQAREQGIAALSLPQNMFTAMNGGVVFNGGGRVQRFNGQTGSQPRSTIGYSGLQFNPMGVNVPERPQLTSSSRDERDLLEELEEKVRTGTATPSERRRYNALRALSLDMYGSRRSSSSDVPDYTQDIAGKDFTYPTRAIQDKTTGDKKETTKSTAGATSAAKAGIGSLPNRPSFEQNLETLRPYLERSPEETLYSRALAATYNQIEEAVRKGKISEDDAKKIMEAKKAELATQYADYTKGRGERMEKTRTALEGEAPTFQERVGRGLARLPADLRGVRLGGALAAIAGGASEVDADYRKRKLAAAKYMAEAEELNAKADLLEQRGQTDAAERARDAAEKRAKEGAALEVTGLQTKASGIQSLLTPATTERGRIATAAGQLFGAELDEESKKRLLAEQAKYREPRAPSALQERLALFKSDPATYEKLFGDKTSGRRPGPRDIVAVQQHVAGLPLEQLPLSNEVRLAIKNDAKSLKDPTSRLNQEIQEARNKVAQRILSSGITDADDILSGR